MLSPFGYPPARFACHATECLESCLPFCLRILPRDTLEEERQEFARASVKPGVFWLRYFCRERSVRPVFSIRLEVQPAGSTGSSITRRAEVQALGHTGREAQRHPG